MEKFVNVVDIGQDITKFEKYFKIRKEIFLMTLEKLDDENLNCLSPLAKLNEFGTINLDFGRQTGSTYFHHWLLNYLTENNYKSMSLIYNNCTLKYFISSHIADNKSINKIDNHILNIMPNKLKINEYYNPETGKIETYQHYDGFRGHIFDVLIFDTSAICKYHILKTLIKDSILCNVKMVIML